MGSTRSCDCHRLYNITQIHSLTGRRPQRGQLKETEGQENQGSTEKKKKGIGLGKENSFPKKRTEAGRLSKCIINGRIMCCNAL